MKPSYIFKKKIKQVFNIKFLSIFVTTVKISVELSLKDEWVKSDNYEWLSRGRLHKELRSALSSIRST